MPLKNTKPKQKKSPEEKKREERAKRLWKTYGLTTEDAADMLVKQQGGCWICGKEDGRLCVDHIHVSGYKKMKPEEKRIYVRAILCFYCNTALRVFERTKDGKRNRALLEGVKRYFDVYKLKGELE